LSLAQPDFREPSATGLQVRRRGGRHDSSTGTGAYGQPEAAGFFLRGIKGIFVAIGSVIAAIICAVIAGTKGRNPFGWGTLGLFFSIFTLIVVAVIPSTR
jgi:hypothetical protein